MRRSSARTPVDSPCRASRRSARSRLRPALNPSAAAISATRAPRKNVTPAPCGVPGARMRFSWSRTGAAPSGGDGAAPAAASVGVGEADAVLVERRVGVGVRVSVRVGTASVGAAGSVGAGVGVEATAGLGSSRRNGWRSLALGGRSGRRSRRRRVPVGRERLCGRWRGRLAGRRLGAGEGGEQQDDGGGERRAHPPPRVSTPLHAQLTHGGRLLWTADAGQGEISERSARR